MNKRTSKVVSSVIAGSLVLGTAYMTIASASTDTLVPLRAGLESEGASVGWNQETKTVSFTLKNGLTGSVKIGAKEFELGGDKAALSQEVVLKNDRTYIPKEMMDVLKTKDLAKFVLHKAGYEAKVLTQGESTLKDSQSAQKNFDLNAYIAINGSEEGWLYTSNETRPGGGFLQRVKKSSDGFYEVTDSKRISFDSVGGTWNNCAGNITPWGTILSGEEYAPKDATDKRFQEAITKAQEMGVEFSSDPLNFGLVVEIDPATGSVKKHRSLGRMSHESAIVLPDKKTAFTTDDNRGGIIAKFVADKEGDLSSGTLYAYKKDTKEWIEIPDDQLDNAPEYARAQGATAFDRPEDIEYSPVDGMIYFAETGDNKKEGNLKYGRVWQLNPQTNELKLVVEGSADTFANVDNLAIDPITGDLYLHEDNYEEFMLPTVGQDNNAMWKYSLKDQKLEKFASVAFGAEITGGTFTPDGKVMFVNMQHPASPNKDQLLMIKGFNK